MWVPHNSYKTYRDASNTEEVLFTDNLSRLKKLEKDGTVKGVLKVPFPTYEVTGSMPVEGEEFSNVLLLGYEYPGYSRLIDAGS